MLKEQDFALFAKHKPEFLKPVFALEMLLGVSGGATLSPAPTVDLSNANDTWYLPLFVSF